MDFLLLNNRKLGQNKKQPVSGDPTDPVCQPLVLKLFFRFLPLTNKLYAIFRIWFHSEPFRSISVSSATAEVIQAL